MQQKNENFFEFPITRSGKSPNATVICCIDHEFGATVEAFIRETEIRPHRISIPGGVKAFKNAGADRDLVTEWIIKSIQLGSRQVLLTAHIDCLAFGGSGAFQDREHEVEHHKEMLDQSARHLSTAIPAEVGITTGLITARGLSLKVIRRVASPTLVS